MVIGTAWIQSYLLCTKISMKYLEEKDTVIMLHILISKK